jgi:thiol-disulfide isomerase/thioredoxin
MPRLCLVAIVSLLVLAACKSELTPPPGDVAGALTVETIDGAPFDPDTLRGKPVIVLFWRVGCSYCMNEMPVVAELAREKGAAAVAVLVAGSREKAAEIAKDFDGIMLVDDGSLRTRYEIKKVPYTLVLRGDGTARHAFLGEQSRSTLASALDGVID